MAGWALRKLEDRPAAEDIPAHAAMMESDLARKGYLDCDAERVAEAMETLAASVIRWPKVAQLIPLVAPRPAPPPAPQVEHDVDEKFHRREDESQADYNLRMAALLREIITAGRGPVKRHLSPDAGNVFPLRAANNTR